jgi:RimJ/RimL family protein N-acetyltransferase
MIVVATQPGELAWLEARAGCVLTRDARGIKAQDRTGRIRGMVGFDGWTQNSVQVHVAAENPLVWRKLLDAGRSYIFREVGLGLMYGCIRSDNFPALRFAGHACMEVEHKFKDAIAPGVDLVCTRMRREDYMLQFELAKEVA